MKQFIETIRQYAIVKLVVWCSRPHLVTSPLDPLHLSLTHYSNYDLHTGHDLCILHRVGLSVLITLDFGAAEDCIPDLNDL